MRFGLNLGEENLVRRRTFEFRWRKFSEKKNLWTKKTRTKAC